MGGTNVEWEIMAKPKGNSVRKIVLSYLITLIFVATAVTPVLALPNDPPIPNPPPSTVNPQSFTSPPISVSTPSPIREAVANKQAEAEAVITEIKDLDLELSLAVEAFNKARIQVEETEQKLQATQTKLDEAQAKYEERKLAFNERVSGIYKNSQVNILEIILNTKNFTDFIIRISFLARIGMQDVVLLTELKEAKGEVEEVKAQLITLRDQQFAAQQELEAEKSTIGMKLTERRLILESVSTDILELLKQEEERRAREAAALLEQAKSELANYSPQISPVVTTSFLYIGIPYLWGGETPEEGFDCSGLLMYIFAQYGVKIPHSSQMQSKMGEPVEGELLPGDLVFFGNPIHHVGMYVGADYFIHAPKTGDVVKISRLSRRNDFAWARRFPLQTQPNEQAQPAPPTEPVQESPQPAILHQDSST